MPDTEARGSAADPVDELRARVAALEAENATLRGLTVEAEEARRSSRGRAPGRAILSSMLIVIGLIAGTAGLVTAFAKQQLLDTTAFVASFAPLAEDRAVQAVVTDAVTGAIDDAIDIPALTSDVIDGIRDLGLPPRADAALGLLEAPAAQGLQGLVDSSVEAIVTSDAFSATWEQALRVSHTQMLATLRGEDDAALAIADGALHLQIGPLIAGVKERLLDEGIALAEAIPAVDRSIVLVEDESFERVRAAAELVDALGTWLPWVSLALLVAGVLAARGRRRAVTVAAVSTAVLMGIVIVGLAAAAGVLVRAADRGAGVLTGDSVRVAFGAATGLITQMASALCVLAVAVVIVAWAAGPSRTAAAVRSATVDAAGAVRAHGERRGVTTGRAGGWIDRHHRALIIVVGVVAAAVILLSRPLSVATIVWTGVLSVVALVVIELLRRPDGAYSSALVSTHPADSDHERPFDA